MSLIVVINAILAICGGILGASAFIVGKRPDAQRLVDRLTPYQTLIGVGLIAVGLIDFFKSLKGLTDFFKVNLYSAAALLTMIFVSILLGVLFGAPQIMKWMGGGPPPPPNPYAQMYQQMQAQQMGQPMGYPPPPQMGYPPPQQNKLLEMQQKIAPFQVMIGLLAILASLVVLLYQFKILKYSGAHDPF